MTSGIVQKHFIHPSCGACRTTKTASAGSAPPTHILTFVRIVTPRKRPCVQHQTHKHSFYSRQRGKPRCGEVVVFLCTSPASAVEGANVFPGGNCVNSRCSARGSHDPGFTQIWLKQYRDRRQDVAPEMEGNQATADLMA